MGGNADGVGSGESFSGLKGLVYDDAGGLIVADHGNRRLPVSTSPVAPSPRWWWMTLVSDMGNLLGLRKTKGWSEIDTASLAGQKPATLASYWGRMASLVPGPGARSVS